MPKPPKLEDLLRAANAGGEYKLRTYPDGSYEYEALDAADDALGRAHIEAWQRERAASMQHQSAANASPAAPPSAAAAPDAYRAEHFGPTIGELIETYKLLEADSLPPGTWEGRARAFRSYAGKIGYNTRVKLVKKTVTAQWVEFLARGDIAKATVANYVSNVSQLFDMAIRQGHITENTVAGVASFDAKERRTRINEGYGWEPLEVDQLKALFDPVNLKRTRTDHVRWGAVIGLFTGLRVGETAQIYLRDFHMDGRIQCLHVTNESDGQSLKTASSKRVVPLHPDLLALGLMDRVAALRRMGHTRLFPGVELCGAAGTGNAISKGFGYYLKAMNVTPRREKGTVGFHSLRKTVIQTVTRDEPSRGAPTCACRA